MNTMKVWDMKKRKNLTVNELLEMLNKSEVSISIAEDFFLINPKGIAALILSFLEYNDNSLND